MTVASANDGSDKNLPPSIAGERGGENISKQEEELVKRYVEMLGDTPLRLEVDFAVPDSYHTSSITFNSDTMAALDAYCRRENISLFSLALGVMYTD